MQVAVVPVKVMQGAVDEVVDVVAVRHGGVGTARVVLRRALHGSAGRGPAPVHLEDVLAAAGGPGRVEVAVVEIIGVIAMTNGPMTAARPVHVRVVFPVLHGASPSSTGSIVRRAAPGQAGSERA